MEFYDCYALNYATARAAFLRVARDTGANLRHYLHPTHQGPQGQDLYVDVAYYGAVDASRKLLVLSATHGLEGLSGSAAQLAWMQGDGPQSLPADVAVVMVHAINPWGFAHLSRTTENNVDLNRNFIDHAHAPANPAYEQLHTRVLFDHWTTQNIAAAQQAMDDFSAQYGSDALFDALARGQYSCPDGLNYGGQQREWSNLVLEEIVEEHILGAEKVAFIDWHTGVGEYGEPFFLCFNEEGGPLFEQASSWWGESRIKGQRPHGKARPNYQGLLFHGVQQFLGDTPLCGAVIEFGTRGWHMRRMLRLDLWLKFKADPNSAAYAMLQTDLLDSFCPFDQIWRDSTVQHAQEITRQAVHGLANW